MVPWCLCRVWIKSDRQALVMAVKRGFLLGHAERRVEVLNSDQSDGSGCSWAAICVKRWVMEEAKLDAAASSAVWKGRVKLRNSTHATTQSQSLLCWCERMVQISDRTLWYSPGLQYNNGFSSLGKCTVKAITPKHSCSGTALVHHPGTAPGMGTIKLGEPPHTPTHPP